MYEGAFHGLRALCPHLLTNRQPKGLVERGVGPPWMWKYRAADVKAWRRHKQERGDDRYTEDREYDLATFPKYPNDP